MTTTTNQGDTMTEHLEKTTTTTTTVDAHRNDPRGIAYMGAIRQDDFESTYATVMVFPLWAVEQVTFTGDVAKYTNGGISLNVGNDDKRVTMRLDDDGIDALIVMLQKAKKANAKEVNRFNKMPANKRPFRRIDKVGNVLVSRNS